MRVWNRLVLIPVLSIFVALLPNGRTSQLYAEKDPRRAAAIGPAAASSVYLPVIFKIYQNVPPRRANAPYFNDSLSVTGSHFAEMAIFWFGKVSQTENYADVRVGYNNTDLYAYLAAFDRRLWYDTSPSVADLTAWDSATLYLNLTGNTGDVPSTNGYKFDSALSFFEARASYQVAYRGNGSGWGPAALSFTTTPGYRGSYNNDLDDSGSALTFKVPFASLGLSGPPAQGTVWGMAVVMHDRDSSAGSPAIADKTWPEANVDALRPVTWGKLGFGLPTYSPPGYSSTQTITISEGGGVTVPDAAVGGTGGNLCGGSADFWTQWGNINHASDNDFAIQNQSDIADFPCFAKYYVTFPLTSLPSGKVIVSATLTLHQMGGSGPASNGDPPSDALIQVMSVAEDWGESSLTWNNAPLAFENDSSRTWVGMVVGCGGSISWPCVPQTWNVSRVTAQAYSAGNPLRLVLYSADSAYSTGKYFTSSETGAWNAAGRPILQVTWGNP